MHLSPEAQRLNGSRAERWLSFCLLLMLAVMWPSGRSYAQTPENAYSNDAIGVQAVSNERWQIYTNRDNAPAVMQANFPPGKGPNESPLFIGMHQSQVLYNRLLVEPWFGDLPEYVRTLTTNLASQDLIIRRARMLPDETAAELEYVHEALGLYFIERLSRLEDSMVLRMAFWMPQSARDEHTDTVHAGFDNMRIRNVLAAPAGYQPVWAQLEDRLPSGNLPGIAGQRAGATASAPITCNDPGSSMLWEVTGAGLDSRGITLHLFGSIHVGKREFYPLHPVIEAQFRSADTLVFEVDPQMAMDPGQAIRIQVRGMLPDGQTLPDVLSDEAFANLQEVVGSLGLPLAGFMNFKPWLLTLMLANFQANAQGFNAEFGIESYITREKSSQSEVRQLESLDAQVDMLDSLNQELFLGYSLREFEASAQGLDDLIEAWQCADHETLSALLFAALEDPSLSAADQADIEILNRKLFTDRNMNMTNTLEDFISTASGAWFVVIGSGHLLGEDSVVGLLRQRGYQVEPVRIE